MTYQREDDSRFCVMMEKSLIRSSSYAPVNNRYNHSLGTITTAPCSLGVCSVLCNDRDLQLLGTSSKEPLGVGGENTGIFIYTGGQRRGRNTALGDELSPDEIKTG